MLLNRHQTARVLEEKKAAIMEEWELASRQQILAAKLQSPLALRDSLPKFLERLIVTLKSHDPDNQARSNAEVAKEHAEDRANQPEYSLEQVISEYHILRSKIMARVGYELDANSEARGIIDRFVDLGITRAVVTYHEIELERQTLQKQEIEATRVAAERANSAKSDFLANMSHEIRTPLGAIMGFVGLLKTPALQPSEVANYISIIDRNSKDLMRIIDDILDLSKIEAGKMLIENVTFPLIEFFGDFSSWAESKARDKGIAFKTTQDTDLPELLISDPTRLRQILSNVVGNAIKFTDTGGVQLHISFTEGSLAMTVIDTGNGISSEQLSKLFQPFAQADSSTTRRFGGTGLGLVLTKKLCLALGGDFKLVKSVVGEGSTFHINIPIQTPTHSSLIPLTGLERSHKTPLRMEDYAADLKGTHILLVEDSPDNQFLIGKMLAPTGAAVTTAADGLEGINLALSGRYDVILLDIQMPIMDGHEAARTLRARGFAAPIVALTAHAMNEERARAIESGFSHFLTKPIDRKSLLALLMELRRAD